jgi:hypothetical protein
MWARWMVAVAGLWLLASPLWFAGDHTAEQICGGMIAVFSVCSFTGPLRHAHLLTGLAGIGMIAVAVQAGNLAAPAQQNLVLTGLLVAMLAVVPNHAMSPPDSWANFHGGQ